MLPIEAQFTAQHFQLVPVLTTLQQAFIHFAFYLRELFQNLVMQLTLACGLRTRCCQNCTKPEKLTGPVIVM